MQDRELRRHITKHPLQSVIDFEIHPQRCGIKTPKSSKQESHNTRVLSERAMSSGKAENGLKDSEVRSRLGGCCSGQSRGLSFDKDFEDGEK